MRSWYDAGSGQTPLDADEVRGLLFGGLTRGDLNELEQVNITEALTWALGRGRLKTELLTVDGLLGLHRRMFGDVWDWAGNFRTTEKNIGGAPYEKGSELQKACDAASFRLDEGNQEVREAA
ncbi:MAG: cell filamentation protein Fic, partial [bacterium]|nr:cell filamentation protein Fic [bacterium]